MGDDEVAAALADHLDRGFGSPGSDGVPNPFRAPSLFTFTYRTGDGSGMDAWCEASASAPLGAGGETVTITKGGEVDQRSQEFIISPFELEGPRSLFAAAGLTGGPSAGTAPSGGYDARAPSRDDGERPDVVLEEWTPPERDDVESGDVPAAVRDAAPKRMVSALARMCRSYYVRSQRYTGGDGGEPWHFGGARGTEVPKNKKLFPGGTNQRLTSTSEVPSGGKPVSPSPEAPKHLDEMLALFGNPFKEPSIYQYKVETGPGMGAGARCIVTATTDLNPASPERHTLRQVVRVDPDTLELTVQPLVETNAYE